MVASFTKCDTSPCGTLQAGPMGFPLSKILLYSEYSKLYAEQVLFADLSL